MQTDLSCLSSLFYQPVTSKACICVRVCVCVCCTLHHGVGVAITSIGGNGILHYLPLAVEALHTQVDLVTQTGVAQQQLMGVLVEELAARGLLQHLLMVCLHQHKNPFINAGDTQVLSKIVSDYGNIQPFFSYFLLPLL